MIRSLIKGIALLRYPELVRDLGERRFHLSRIETIAKQNPTCKLDRDIRLIGHAPGLLELGSEVTINSGTVVTFGNPDTGPGLIRISSRTWIGQYNNLRAGPGEIVIGTGCLISQFCTLIASNHNIKAHSPILDQGLDTTRSGIVLEDDIWLGAGVVVVPGVTVGRGTVIGANAVVTQDVPPFEIWAGVPAAKIGERS